MNVLHIPHILNLLMEIHMILWEFLMILQLPPIHIEVMSFNGRSVHNHNSNFFFNPSMSCWLRTVFLLLYVFFYLYFYYLVSST